MSEALSKDQCGHDYTYQGIVYSIGKYPLPGSGAKPVTYYESFFCRRCLDRRFVMLSPDAERGDAMSAPDEPKAASADEAPDPAVQQELSSLLRRAGIECATGGNPDGLEIAMHWSGAKRLLALLTAPAAPQATQRAAGETRTIAAVIGAWKDRTDYALVDLWMTDEERFGSNGFQVPLGELRALLARAPSEAHDGDVMADRLDFIAREVAGLAMGEVISVSRAAEMLGVPLREMRRFVGDDAPHFVEIMGTNDRMRRTAAIREAADAGDGERIKRLLAGEEDENG